MKFELIFLCVLTAVKCGPIRDADIKKNRHDSLSTLTLPSNATSIRADITDNFSCNDKPYGYYADIDNDCQIFHVCLPVQYSDSKERIFRWSFICPDETVFSQQSFTCVRTEDLSLECSESEKYYELNRNFGITTSEEENSSETFKEVNPVVRKQQLKRIEERLTTVRAILKESIDTSSTGKPIIGSAADSPSPSLATTITIENLIAESVQQATTTEQIIINNKNDEIFENDENENDEFKGDNKTVKEDIEEEKLIEEKEDEKENFDEVKKEISLSTENNEQSNESETSDSDDNELSAAHAVHVVNLLSTIPTAGLDPDVSNAAIINSEILNDNLQGDNDEDEGNVQIRESSLSATSPTSTEQVQIDNTNDESTPSPLTVDTTNTVDDSSASSSPSSDDLHSTMETESDQTKYVQQLNAFLINEAIEEPFEEKIELPFRIHIIDDRINTNNNDDHNDDGEGDGDVVNSIENGNKNELKLNEFVPDPQPFNVHSDIIDIENINNDSDDTDDDDDGNIRKKLIKTNANLIANKIKDLVHSQEELQLKQNGNDVNHLLAVRSLQPNKRKDLRRKQFLFKADAIHATKHL